MTDSPAADRTLWSCGLLAGVVLVALAGYLYALQPGVVALQLTFTPSAFAQVIHSWPAEHLARFRNHLPADYVLLLAYGTFGYRLATRTRTFAAAGPLLQWLAAVALPAAALFDAIENVLHGWLTAAPRLGFSLVYAGAGTAATLKWLLIVAFALLLLHARATALWRHDPP